MIECTGLKPNGVGLLLHAVKERLVTVVEVDRSNPSSVSLTTTRPGRAGHDVTGMSLDEFKPFEPYIRQRALLF